MTRITKHIDIDAGHRIPNHSSKCCNPHGHRYRIEVAVDDKLIDIKGASDEGMVMDFSDLKLIMMEEIDKRLDHGFMIYTNDPLIGHFRMMRDVQKLKIIEVPFIPTAENIAKWLYEIMKIRLSNNNIKIKYVDVEETPTSSARYTTEDELK